MNNNPAETTEKAHSWWKMAQKCYKTWTEYL